MDNLTTILLVLNLVIGLVSIVIGLMVGSVAIRITDILLGASRKQRPNQKKWYDHPV